MEQDIQQLQNIIDIFSEFAVNYGFQVFGAIVILLIGWQVSRWVARAVLKVCERAGLDITLAKFFAGIAKSLIIIFVAIVALGKFGITITPLVAALGAIAFGSTLALLRTTFELRLWPDHYSDQTVRRWRHNKNPERHRDRGRN